MESPRPKSLGGSGSRRNKSFSTHGRFSSRLTPEFDPSTYSAGQSLASILNNPHHSGSDSSWSSWIFSADPSSSIDAAAPPASKSLLPEADFRAYVESISEPYSRFVDVQEHFFLEEDGPSTSSSSSGEMGLKGGEGLAACLREIPNMFFDEDFALERGSTFQAACPFSTIPQNIMLQERLTQYLDVVEVHLVKEISARSESFFEAQKQLEDLNERMLEACQQMKELKSTVRLLENDLVGSATQVHTLSRQRENVLALHDKLKLMTYVNQAVSALRILVATADCGGALDVIDELQQLLVSDELAGMHCFRHLGDQLAASTDSVNNMLAADFVRIAIHNSKDLDSSVIISSLNMKDKLYSMSVEVQVNEEEETNLRELLVPFVIGLLRTSKLPAVLKVYKDTLTTDVKSAIKTVVAECLPILLNRSSGDSPATEKQTEIDVSGLNLAAKLRSLSPDAFVQLLVAVFKIIQTRLVRAAKIRQLVEQIVSGLQGTSAAEAVAAAFASGAAAVAAAVAAAEAAEEVEPQGSLAQIVTDSDPLNLRGRGVQLSSISKQFRADVLRENTEALWAACDAAHGRWVKLLGVRAPVHPKLRLQEFVSIHDVTQEFIAATEKVGGRLGYSIRGTLQSQSKSFVDSQHILRITKITAVLDQETWVAVDIPDEFQEIVDKVFIFDDSLENGEAESHSEANGECQPVENGGSIAPHDEKLETDSSTVTTVDKKLREKSIKTIRIGQIGYHTVNSGLILLKMIAEYVELSNALPALAAEVVHRVAEILKVFNSRACQLVLGAGALQVSGLKSITAKHLALASQTITFFHVLIPEMKKVLSVFIPDPRKALLLNELDRIAQDYKVHREEIHTKLVQIMKERLQVHLRILPQVVEGWNKAAPDDADAQPSQFARTLTKEVGVLHRVLSPLLLEDDLRSIFSRVVLIFHTQLTETFSSLEVSTPQGDRRLYRDVSHILACIRGLPSDPIDPAQGNAGKDLDAFLAQRFGNDVPQ
ncbi:vacuolar protein sorting-associated protein 54, chloroplastic isoform X2 [Selaginella moellendorffii]|uniref:vacuolar protein sorting-associated protein 54, chloroplastic isoform X2 n=1 Tax=Selaginella moellendorffii TaxID=88036 RepID=UPI000D1C71F3|nr:vacuolar protein sorting-associated protein 54, chloroplastic isoform X2 [Selaginella moellendorffii]|eukprot:XP_024532479.1 vacuolar protein sorting-associated protein 54, chloroplastic isoform X2 [Selaginella moellendorffii]